MVEPFFMHILVLEQTLVIIFLTYISTFNGIFKKIIILNVTNE